MTAIVARLRALPSWQVALSGALLVLGFLIVAQLRAEAPPVRYTTQERPPLMETALELQNKQDALKAQILDLRASISDIETSAAGDNALLAGLNSQLQEARLEAGLVELQGPGLVVQLEDSTQPVAPGKAAGDYRVSASDLRDVVNELWLAGAEAIGVNGERVTATSAITDIGSSILLNSAYLQPPYQITAIGPPSLYGGLTSSVSFVGFVRDRVQDVGLRLGIAQLQTAVVPAYAGSVKVTYGLPVATAGPSATPSPRTTPSPRARPSGSAATTPAGGTK